MAQAAAQFKKGGRQYSIFKDRCGFVVFSSNGYRAGSGMKRFANLTEMLANYRAWGDVERKAIMAGASAR